MKFYVVSLVFLLLIVSKASARIQRILEDVDEGVVIRGDCEFRVNGDLNDPAPLFSRYNAYEIIIPDPADTVRFSNGELLDMFCPDGFEAPFEGFYRVTAQCVQQKYFLVDGLIYPFSTFNCTQWPTFAARRTGRECNGGTDLVEVGFEVEDGGFLQTYDVCHNEEEEVTRYVHHVLYPTSNDPQQGVARPGFITLDFYGGKPVNTMYTQVQQNITISEILGMDASDYFNYEESRFLARGHLCARSDQIFGAAQKATFLFINVAPQWQTFNGGNWEKIEKSVKKYVADSNLTADCYTGTWGVTTLPDVNGEPQPLYLDFDENNNGLIPVPRLYFRVVIDRESRKGIVFVGVNNPYVSLEEIQRDYVLCEDIGHQLNWLTWLKEDLMEGYSYACTVESFVEIVKDLPLEDLYTTGILGIDDDVTTSTTIESSSSTTEESTTPSTEYSSSSTTEQTTTTTEESTTPSTEYSSSSTTEQTTTTTEESTTPSTEYSSTSTTEESTSPSTEYSSSSTIEQTTTTTEESTTTSTTEASSTESSTSTESISTSTTPVSTTTDAPTSTSTSTSSTTVPPTPTTEPNVNQCRFNINGDLTDPAPLFTPDGALSWLLPDESGHFIVNEGESFELHCTGALRLPFNKFSAVSALCLGNNTYESEDIDVTIQSFRCQSWPTYEAQRTGESCPGGTELVHIGFDVAAGFLPQIELCYNETLQATSYVRYELTPANIAYQEGVAQPGYLRSDFYTGRDVNTLYSLSQQLITLSTTLGVDASIYLDSSRDLYLNRGHLAPRHDFVHGSAQRATHFYVNTAPQWRSVSIGNWQSIEQGVRDFVALHGLNVSVHSGTWDVSTLPNAEGVQTPLYLNADTEQLPVPRFHYRIVIDQDSREGIVLVAVNNPHIPLEEVLQDYVICKDVGHDIDWIDWDKTNLHDGYAYACDVAEFIEVVQDLPLEQLYTTGVLGVTSLAASICNFRINGGDLNDPAPLFVVRDERGVAQWVEVDVDGTVRMQHGDHFEMHCTTRFLAPFAEYRMIEASCHDDYRFEAWGSVHNFSAFVCSAWPTYTARHTGRPCNGGTDLAEVGFELGSADDFLQIFDSCHDEDAEANRYVHHVLTPGSAQYQRSVTRPTFITGDFYDGKAVNTMYTQVQQQLTVAAILGMEDVSQYFNISNNIYMARGHLAAKTDFIFGAPQKATFFFINAAPQWQSFNGGNWERVEDSVRKFVSSEQITTDCYTGTWGISTLPDVNGEPQELYLNFDENNNGLIPVPKLYYRVIIDRASRKGIVLIGVNNPHASLEEIQRDYVICDDISDQLDWVSWTKDSLYLGYSYACTVEDFIEVVKDLPLDELYTEGVLGV